MILETTHHGHYRAVRYVDTLDAETLATTPYGPYRASLVNDLAASLAATGTADHGWTRWEVAQ